MYNIITNALIGTITSMMLILIPKFLFINRPPTNTKARKTRDKIAANMPTVDLYRIIKIYIE